ncbi:MAG: 50S ribosomal protein L20 [uncultured bacterium]|nr:MAG: 50S ribosomal protein L20 [uncultured bacterium]
MTRVKRGVASKKRKKKILARAKGFLHGRKNKIKLAKEATIKAGKRAYVGRKHRKRDARRLWQVRINAAARKEGLSYSKFMNMLKKKKISLNRKTLAELALDEPKVFKNIVEEVKEKIKKS